MHLLLAGQKCLVAAVRQSLLGSLKHSSRKAGSKLLLCFRLPSNKCLTAASRHVFQQATSGCLLPSNKCLTAASRHNFPASKKCLEVGLQRPL
jgi:hypothetical protein